MTRKINTKINSERSLVILLAILLVTCMASTTLAEGISAEASLEKTTTSEKTKTTPMAPWRGSSFTYGNTTSAITLNKEAELGYDPYYAMEFSFDPRWWVGDIFNLRMNLALTREFTHSAWTTYSGETLINDVSATFGFSNFLTIPKLGIGISGKLGISAPTSKVSQARTKIIGLTPGLSLSKSFSDVLSGVSLFYAAGFRKDFHDATTAITDDPRALMSLGTKNSESFANTGRRNQSMGLSNTFGLNIAFIKKYLSLGASFTLAHGFLYHQSDDMLINSDYPYLVEDSNDVRYSMMYNVEISSQPIPALGIAIGANTFNSQLRPDSTYQSPFFNRYTNVYLNLILSIDGLVQTITSSEE